MKIIDNFLPENDFKEIQDLVLGRDFPWFRQSSIATPEDNELCYFTHIAYNNESGGVNSQYWRFFYDKFFKHIKHKTIIRFKVNYYQRTKKIIVNDPHTDYYEKHKGVILYLNNCDGYTLLNNKKKVDSIENRLLMFDPSKNHSSTTTTNAQGRFNINVNYRI